MASNVTLVVSVDGAQVAVREVKHVGDEAQDAGGKLEGFGKKAKGAGDDAEKAANGPLSKLGGALGDVAKIAGGFVVAQGLTQLPGLLTGMAKAAAEDEQATLRMHKALENYIAATDGGALEVQELVDATDALISKGQKLAFSDDDVRDSLQSLLAATGDYGEATKRQAAAMDLARGAGIPLEQATRMLGKINSENVEVFRKMGIVLGENATEADALAAVQAKFGGQAETYAKSTAGQFEIAKIRMAEAKETIGAALLPAMASLGTVLAEKVIPAFEAFAAEVGPAVQEGFAILKEDVIPWFQETAIPAVQSFVEAVRPTFEEIGRIITTYVVPALQEIGRVIEENWPAMQQAIQDAMAAIGEQLQKFGSYYESDIKPATENIRKAIEAVVQFVIEHWPEIERVVRPVVEQVGLVIESLAKIIRDLVALVVDLIQGDWSGAWENLKEIVNTAVGLVRGTLDNLIEFLGGLAAIFLKLMTAAGEAMRDGLIAGLKGALGLAKDIANAVIELFENAINSVIQMINDAIPNKISIPHLPDINLPDNPIGSVHIPRMAAGGIVTRPTLALIGEAGPEAVVPLPPGSYRTAYQYPSAAGLAANAAFLSRMGGMTGVGQWVVDGRVIADTRGGQATSPDAVGAPASADVDIWGGLGAPSTGDQSAAARERILYLLSVGAITAEQAEAMLTALPGGSTTINGYGAGWQDQMAAYGPNGIAQSGAIGAIPGGAPSIVIQAIDAQSVRDWLNRGGGEEIMRWFRRSVA